MSVPHLGLIAFVAHYSFNGKLLTYGKLLFRLTTYKYSCLHGKWHVARKQEKPRANSCCRLPGELATAVFLLFECKVLYSKATDDKPVFGADLRFMHLKATPVV